MLVLAWDVVRWSAVGNAVIVFYFLADGLSVDGFSVRTGVFQKGLVNFIVLPTQTQQDRAAGMVGP